MLPCGTPRLECVREGRSCAPTVMNNRELFETIGKCSRGRQLANSGSDTQFPITDRRTCSPKTVEHSVTVAASMNEARVALSTKWQE
jgi:hypothetical protein